MDKHSKYLDRVMTFMADNGPEFTLSQITNGKTDCEACGRPEIHALFVVQSKGTGKLFTVGSECQALVLTSPEDLAKLPARHIRKLDATNLMQVAAALGAPTNLATAVDVVAALVLHTRRQAAAKRGWLRRKAAKAGQPVI